MSIDDLMAGGARPYRHVSLEGDAYYDVGYTETSNGATTAIYYIFLDPKGTQGLVVRAPTTSVPAQSPASITLTGLIHTSPPELSNAVEADLAMYRQHGVEVDPSFYLAEGERPMDAPVGLAILLGSVGLGVVAFVPLFFPTTVFAPQPATMSAAPSPLPPGQNVQATGRFQQLKSLHPTLETGRRWQRFTNAVANLITLQDGRLMIYIHHVVRTRMYGAITVSKRESDWAVLVSKSDPWQIEPGTIYGWKDRPAVRFRRQEMGRKMDDVYVIFNHPSPQAEFVTALRTSGFAVGMGLAS
jgi:hypothetical protein